MKYLALLVAPIVFLAGGCISHSVQMAPITVEPVQVTMDVTLHVDDQRSETDDADVVEDALDPAPAAPPAASPPQAL